MGLFGSDKRSRRRCRRHHRRGKRIGAAFAVELAKRGGRVVCSDIDENAAQATADQDNLDVGLQQLVSHRDGFNASMYPGFARSIFDRCGTSGC